MSLPPRYDVSRVCNFPFDLSRFNFFGKNKAAAAVYLAGIVFAVANWVFFDAAIVSAHTGPPPDAPHDTVLHVTFADWVPGICSIIGLLVVNLVNKAHLRGDGDSSAFSSSESSVVWKARLFLFLGFAFMAGGLAGSVTVLVLKYIVTGYPAYQYYGVANVVQNGGIMLSAIILWISGTMGENEYDYQLTL